MRFKYYLITNDFEKSINFYENVFQAEIEKKTKRHAKLNFYGEQTFLLFGQESPNKFKEGYLILRFTKDESNLYQETKKRAIEMGCNFHIDDKVAKWGTTFSEFTDPFGYTWDLEIDS